MSYFTSVPSQQLTTAKNNANLIANLLEQSHVKSMESISQTRNDDLRFQVTEYSQISQVTALNENKHNLLLSDLCEYKGTLIGNFIDVDLNSKSSKLGFFCRTAVESSLELNTSSEDNCGFFCVGTFPISLQSVVLGWIPVCF